MALIGARITRKIISRKLRDTYAKAVKTEPVFNYYIINSEIPITSAIVFLWVISNWISLSSSEPVIAVLFFFVGAQFITARIRS